MRRNRMFSLVGVDGNAFAIMAYTKKSMESCGFGKTHVSEMLEKAKSGDYNNLIAVCDEYIQLCNAKVGNTEMLSDEEDDDDFPLYD
jgi:hypothetical protein